VPRVHRTVPRAVVRRRYAQINEFERILAENGTLIVKFFLHISKREQRRRLAERLADPDKAWKFSAGDLQERALWERYLTAYEKLLAHCSTPHAPWYVIPADRKWHRNLAVASVLVHALEDWAAATRRPRCRPPRRGACARRSARLTPGAADRGRAMGAAYGDRTAKGLLRAPPPGERRRVLRPLRAARRALA